MSELIPFPKNILCLIEFKKGIHSDNPDAPQIRKKLAASEEVHIDYREGFAVFKAKVSAKVHQFAGGLSWNNDQGIFLKPNINHRQHQYILIKEENFQEVLESCWSQCRHQSTFK